ncbi:DUF501 domain-containing protein [Ferrimicrobium sp.]|uniref:DUF501 domain-containing protein n=1 Tax=Ferrimicrobium sp. TaxID=2926050 RepID=UPI0026398A06|nr:DUF501 domain-containing protein [Ferrimicrobium sp.]
MDDSASETEWATTADDRAWVEQQLGRVAGIPFRAAVRSKAGRPIVIELASYDREGVPQSNWFWLVDRSLVAAVSRLESHGGVRLATASVKPRALDLANASYRSGRSGLAHMQGRGVGGARAGVKCLHAHVAFYLVGGFTPVGVWAMWRLYQSDRRLLEGLLE